MNIFLTSLVLSTSSYEKIPDLADLPLLSFDLKERQTSKIILPNGLQVLLISDPKADQSAATVAVDAGSWSDPSEYPGMAHFCEHMLFMGTEKYPDTNEFSSMISDFNGHTNAFTAPDKTVYMFSSQEKGFLPILDRFAHFFIDPIFDPSNISRELHAVDQEFALMKENDGWRGYMVFKETGNPQHPNHLFSAGNSQTLSKIPQSALKTWHQDHYSASRMRLAIYSSLPLDVLQNEIAKAFAGVPKHTSLLKDFSAPLSSSLQKKHLILIEPIHNQQHLSLRFELPPHLSNDPSQSASLIAYTLQRGQPHSLLQFLKSKELVDDVRVQLDSHEGKDHAFFEIDLLLSDQGLKEKDFVIHSVFQAIQGLKESGIPESLFLEKNTLAKLGFQYQSRIDAFQYISQIGRTILHEEIATYPRQTLLASHYDKAKITETLHFLSLDQCSITLLAPQKLTHASYDKKEKWLHVPYAIQPLSSEQLIAWSQVEKNPNILLAEPNPFVPQKLDLAANSQEGAPIQIAQGEFGEAYFARCSEYQTPEGSIHLQISTPLIEGSAKSSVLSSLYLDHLTDQLNPTLMAASGAGISNLIEIDKNKLHLSLSGFSEKLPLLLEKITAQMPHGLPSKEQFDLYVSRLKKGYENSAKIIPVKQAKELLTTLINQDKTTKQENLTALGRITFEDFVEFHKNLFEKTYLEALFAGNFSMKVATDSLHLLLNRFNKTPYLPSEHSQAKALHLPELEGPFLISKQTLAQGNAAVLLIDEGDFTPTKKATQKILSSALQEPFFDTLRTKQKTGYIAQSSDTEYEKRLYQFFLVQSNTHQPEDLLHRFELFLEEFREDFATLISESRFETLKESAIFSIKTQCRNIDDKSALLNLLAFQEKGDFSLIERRIQAYLDLTYEQFKTHSLEFLSRANRKRLASLYTGQIPAPFAYTPMNPNDLSKVATYAPRPKEPSHNQF